MAVTLVEAIANLKHYGEREASAIFTQALHELSQLHHAGYVHLNITVCSGYFLLAVLSCSRRVCW